MHDTINNLAFVQNHSLPENRQNSTETQKIIGFAKNVYWKAITNHEDEVIL